MATTYSQLVDEILSLSARPDRTVAIQRFVNQTIRELHSDEKGGVFFFDKNLIEDQLTADANSGFSWTTPAGFQRMQTVRYQGQADRENPQGAYAKALRPGVGQNRVAHFYYRAGKVVYFSGYGLSGDVIDIAYYQFPKHLAYYESALRPASWDLPTTEADGDAAYSYLTATTAAEKVIAEGLSTNWLLEDWDDLVREGSLAKVYKLQADTERAATHFSLYQRQRPALYTTEAFVQVSAM